MKPSEARGRTLGQKALNVVAKVGALVMKEMEMLYERKPQTRERHAP